jgi:AraC-like DNA-binding protein
VTSLSPSQISRKFKKETGISIVEYVQRERVEEAKRMLVFSSRALPEIANCLNFASQSYFTAVFRKIVGMTPAEYRRANG